MAQSRTADTDGVVDIVFDMETGDPDDVLTLLLVAAHPRAHLKAVTLTPGTRRQVGLVRWILRQLGLAETVRVGAQRWPLNADKKIPALERLAVAKDDTRRGTGLRGDGGFYGYFAVELVGDGDCEAAAVVLSEVCDERTTLLTGAALHNLGDALDLVDQQRARGTWRLGRWVGQGGFAGVGVVDEKRVLPKFAGLRECPTWNFDGNVLAARAALDSDLIGSRVLASKNVCHRVYYDKALHAVVGKAVSACQGAHARAMEMVHASMERYLSKKDGKKFHDPLALALCFDESVCDLAEVAVARAKPEKGCRGGWGSVLSPGSGTRISVDYDPGRFAGAILGVPLSDVAPRELAEFCRAAEAEETWYDRKEGATGLPPHAEPVSLTSTGHVRVAAAVPGAGRVDDGSPLPSAATSGAPDGEGGSGVGGRRRWGRAPDRTREVGGV